MDPGIEIDTPVVGTVTGQHNVFHTNYWWFLGAAMVEITCIGFVALVYWKWWLLDRAVSFSPFEMAKVSIIVFSEMSILTDPSQGV